MPITQQRMIDVMDEATGVVKWATALREDIESLLRSSMAPESKLEALDALVAISPAPSCVKIAIERDHFRRTQRRNERSAERMRLKRQRSAHERVE